MEDDQFEAWIGGAFARLPERFRNLLENVAILVEDEPDSAVLKEQGLGEGETLLGLYSGIPQTERPAGYGTVPTLPDTITLYQVPITEEAEESGKLVSEVVYETLWHEIAHHFGMEEDEVERAEERKFGGEGRVVQ